MQKTSFHLFVLNAANQKTIVLKWNSLVVLSKFDINSNIGGNLQLDCKKTLSNTYNIMFYENPV